MIRAKDAVVLGVLFWWLLRDRESTSVELTQTCVDGEGNRITVPLGDCPPGYTLETYEGTESPPYVPELPEYQTQLGGCGCGGKCGGCA